MAGSEDGQHGSLEGDGVGKQSPPRAIVRLALEEDREEVVGKIVLLQSHGALLVWGDWGRCGGGGGRGRGEGGGESRM